jgi:amidohydrolase family protein
MQVLQRRWDRTFSEYSYGFRPIRSAHQAVARHNRLHCGGICGNGEDPSDGARTGAEGNENSGIEGVIGTDAVAGTHGRNAEEFVDRVLDCAVDPMAAMVSANSLGAEAPGLGDQIGSIASGLQADIIALDGDPLKDITAVRREVFVMKGGIVFKNAARGSIPSYAGVQP